jgi:hypothetical protein
MLKGLTTVAGAAAAILWCAPATAAVTVLNFEGIANLAPVGGFYSSLGYEFSPDTLALVDADAGGSGNIANEPSGETGMFFLDSNNAILNVAAGFDTGFSFFYSSSVAAAVTVWSGLDGTGTLLGEIPITGQFNSGCTGDPTGDFCNWTNQGVSFAGVARSINFGGTANQTVYDDITFGSDVAGAVPEPATWGLMILGFGAIGCALRRRRASAAMTQLA